MITGINRPLLTLTFLALITTNILTLTSTAFNAALSGLMGTALGVRTVSSLMQAKIASQGKTNNLKRKAATKKFGTRLASRTKRGAAKSIAAIPAESIPFFGVAVLIKAALKFDPPSAHIQHAPMIISSRSVGIVRRRSDRL